MGIMQKKMDTTIVYWAYMGIMEKKMETTIMGNIGFRTTSRWLRTLFCSWNRNLPHTGFQPVFTCFQQSFSQDSLFSKRYFHLDLSLMTFGSNTMQQLERKNNDAQAFSRRNLCGSSHI